jgi:hypothetical protein
VIVPPTVPEAFRIGLAQSAAALQKDAEYPTRSPNISSHGERLLDSVGHEPAISPKSGYDPIASATIRATVLIVIFHVL